ncbi:hypothetical protein [Rhodohalobacter mucosus]|uniref:Outer membrane protein beta-barrel domain-containing protein n=1 Tax=Rhodohalobacter mucosus TaxID=2079485 RepID=A0A316TQI0_9BACT|nr:hypothetical protein [Rhodohalobacter mucosus]PWN05941.1 hypothetical protein DDZ15_12210 [Rhodohalobacter mucosus]
MNSNSPVSGLLISVLFLTLSMFFLPGAANAQMFSIGDQSTEQRPNAPGIYTIAGFSWEPASFSFQGNGVPVSERVDFDDSILRLRLETPGLELSLGMGGELTGMDETTFTNVSARILNQFYIYRKENMNVFLPVQISTDLLRVRRANTRFEFQQSSFIIGSGIGSSFRVGDRIDFTLRATPNYGFSFSQGNLFGGSLFRFDGKSYLVIRNVIGRRSLALGYHFDFRRYDVEEELNDYDFTSHSFTLGIAF